MSAGQQFVSLVQPTEKRPHAAFSGPAGLSIMLRDQFSIQTWLCLGALVQAALYMAIGRLAFIPAAVFVVYQLATHYLMSIGVLHNRYLDDVIMKKYSAQFADASGQQGSKPANDDVVVFHIGTRCNHPLGILAPGFREMGGYFPQMVKDLEEHAEEFGFLGMTSWINAATRDTGSELMEVGYFRNVEGLLKFAHNECHNKAWAWWNKAVKSYPHISIYHETFHVPRGHWETIYINSHPSHLASAAFEYKDEMTGKTMYASPIVDATKGLLRSSKGRMAMSFGKENDNKYGEDPY